MIQASEPHLAQADWDKVDASTDPAAYVAYLDRLDASPLVQRYRQEFSALAGKRRGRVWTPCCR